MLFEVEPGLLTGRRQIAGPTWHERHPTLRGRFGDNPP